MSENYQYAECKHCGKSVMEGEIHDCKQMLRDEIADLYKALAEEGEYCRQAREDVRALNVRLEDVKREADKWREWHDSACKEAVKWREDAQAFYGALQKISECDECDPEITISLLQLIAREALADRS